MRNLPLANDEAAELGHRGFGGVDWEAAWRAYQTGRAAPATASDWDARAARYVSTAPGADAYERRFLELAHVEPGETVLDFGCGPGVLAVPLARQGCHVVCADFSRGMLAELERRACEAGVRDLIETRLVSWDDDWEAQGLARDSVDVALACRSLATTRLTHALASLDAVARRRVCLTVSSDHTPRWDERAYAATGRRARVVADHVYVLNVLFGWDVRPELTYVTARTWPGFRSRDHARRMLAEMVGGDLNAAEQAGLDAFLDAHYALDPQATDAAHAYRSDAQRVVRWAFISWGDGDGGAVAAC